MNKINVIKNSNSIASLPKTKYFAWLIFGLLTVLSAYFYETRSFTFDAGFKLFTIIQNSWFDIDLGRFAVVLNQLPVLLARKLELPLPILGMIYSLSLTLYLVVFYLFIPSKASKHQWVFLLYPLLLVSHSFFWAHSEIVHTCAFIITFFAVQQYVQHWNWWKILLKFIVIFIIVFWHPLAAVPFLFIWCFFWIENKKSRSVYFYSIPVIFLVIYGVKKLSFDFSYDDNITSSLSSIFDQWWEFMAFKSHKAFRKLWLTDYQVYPVLTLILILFYTKSKQYLKLALFVCFNFGYLFLVLSTFRWALPAFHMESFYQVFSIILLYPLIFDLFPLVKSKKILMYGLLCFVMFRVSSIVYRSQIYTDRVSELITLVNEQPLYSKHYCVSSKPIENHFLYTWSIPTETLLLSAADKNIKTATIFMLYNKSIPNYDFNNSQLYHNEFFTINIKALSDVYFNDLDTLSGYHKLPLEKF